MDDEPDIRQGIELALRSAGYAVDLAEDGEEAVYKAQEWEYDAIILDVMLPRQDGWSVLETIRQKKKTPVIMLTARDDITDRIRGLDLGSDDYVTKPFDLNELIARVRALIRRASGHPQSEITIGPVLIHLSNKNISLNGRNVEVTAKEYGLIEYLSLRIGQVVSRTELYEHLFDEGDDSISNPLDVHVCNVRKKLGKDFIQTRRGLGYVIQGDKPCD